jgi:MFS family permease
LGRWFPVRERATAQSFIWLASRLGGAVAPVIIAGLMAAVGGWRQAFWALGVLGILWAAAFLWWFRDRPEDDPAVSVAERELIRGAAPEPGSIYDDEHRARLPWKALLTPNLLALDLASFCVSFSFYFYITFLPRYLKEEFHLDYGESQLISGLPLLLGGIACLVGGRVSDRLSARSGNKRWGRSLLPLAGWSAAGLCALLVSRLHSATAGIALICVAFVCQDLGVPSMWSLPTDVGGRYAGTVGGCMNACGAIGGMLSPLVAAKVSAAFGWNATFLVFGAVYFVGALAWLRIDAGERLL